MENFLRRFRLYGEKEQPELVYGTISKAVPFRGTNLWILIFAILIASLGLNVNSIAVVIGAMLISPLMGPIVGLGYSAAINDSGLLRKSLTNYLFALAVGLLASTVYFILSPIHETNPQLASRTQPNIYDVLIALFGGFAGILAACSTQKGNVVPGVAIATALMPPLCTAGYGLAHLNTIYLFGALYLFLINSVFIAFATFVTVRYLRYPFKEFMDDKEKLKSQRIIGLVVILTVIPSIYFGWDIVQRNKFDRLANEFIDNECRIEGDVLLRKKVDAKNKKIDLFYIGNSISDSTKNILKGRLKNIYKLNEANLHINIGLENSKNDEEELIDDNMVSVDKFEFQSLQLKFDSLSNEEKMTRELYIEIKALFPTVESAYIQRGKLYTDSTSDVNRFLVHLKVAKRMSNLEQARLQNFLEVKFKNTPVKLLVER